MDGGHTISETAIVHRKVKTFAFAGLWAGRAVPCPPCEMAAA